MAQRDLRRSDASWLAAIRFETASQGKSQLIEMERGAPRMEIDAMARAAEKFRIDSPRLAAVRAER